MSHEYSKGKGPGLLAQGQGQDSAADCGETPFDVLENVTRISHLTEGSPPVVEPTPHTHEDDDDHAPSSGHLHTKDILALAASHQYTPPADAVLDHGNQSGTCAAVALAAQLAAPSRGLPSSPLSHRALTGAVRALAEDTETPIAYVAYLGRTLGIPIEGDPIGRLQIYDCVLLSDIDPGTKRAAPVNLEAWNFWLEHYGPVVARLAANDPLLDGAGTSTSAQAQPSAPGPYPRGHAIVIKRLVQGGYEFTPNLGTSWGTSGNATMSPGEASRCTEGWGLLVGDYPAPNGAGVSTAGVPSSRR